MAAKNKNADKPINPIPHERHEEYGLTKREHFAGLAMQGILANPEWTSASHSLMIKEVMIMTDKLLKQLENTNTQ